ncbi:MAG: hypothetical protein DRR19_03995 [Candidatus Parabeggiatoa sp. nov. 1]|nr:MAG: hypothetical protein DRR19_03995 [Gammaproteobacteria bacterium]
MINITRGDVILCDLNPVMGTEPAGIRPVLVLRVLIPPLHPLHGKYFMLFNNKLKIKKTIVINKILGGPEMWVIFFNSPGFTWGYSHFQAKVFLEKHLPERLKFSEAKL